jgi:predicted lactoylglutathione lyase
MAAPQGQVAPQDQRSDAMPRMIFVNLPVADLGRAEAFYEAIGASRNPMFSDEAASCMVISDKIHVMLLTHDKFRQFTPKPIGDAHAQSSVLLCLSAESREEVDAYCAHAARAGGRIDVGPKIDLGYMYGRSFEDPDGHIWETMFMDMAAASIAMAKG